MKIGIVGSGNVGGTLGARWAEKGHQVIFGSRAPDSNDSRSLLSKAGENSAAGTFEEAVEKSDVIVLAVPWEAALPVVKGLPLAGKVLIDATNPVLPNLTGLSLGTSTSAGEQIAAAAHGAKVVKMMNTVGFNVMEDPDFNGEKPVMFYAGDDADAKKAAAQLAGDLGFDPVDAGPLTQARVLEPFAMLWISLAVANRNRDFAFKMLRR